MTFAELLKNRRSIRKYLDKPVPVEIIKDIIGECILAPSAGNGQPWQFIIINNRKLLDRISAECKMTILARIKNNPDDYAKKYQTMLENDSFHIFYHAPCVVMILGLSTVKNLYADCALAASYFMMSAVAKGLGTCWVNFGTQIHTQDLKNTLGIPDDCTIVAPLTLGYPEHIPSPPKRNNPVILNTLT